MKILDLRMWLPALVFALASTAPSAQSEPITIAFDGGFSVKTNTAPQAITLGMQIAVNEINASGGVLNGRLLTIKTTDNHGLATRARDNFELLSKDQSVVAVLGGKFSPAIIETMELADRLNLLSISVWGSADQITDSNPTNPFVFRLSLKDEWAINAMLRHAKLRYKATRVCTILPNTAWGRSGDWAIRRDAPKFSIEVVAQRWYNWGEKSFASVYQRCLEQNADVVILIGNEQEGSLLVEALSEVPPSKRLPVISHWGVTGGSLQGLIKNGVSDMQFDIIQTFTFISNSRPRAVMLSQRAMQYLQIASATQIPSPVGVAQAYDMVHLLALAMNQANSTDRTKIRDALENLPPFSGAIRDYNPAFSKTRHDALSADQVLFVRINAAGELIPLEK